jgi:hypothetical protein
MRYAIRVNTAARSERARILSNIEFGVYLGWHQGNRQGRLNEQLNRIISDCS